MLKNSSLFLTPLLFSISNGSVLGFIALNPTNPAALLPSSPLENHRIWRRISPRERAPLRSSTNGQDDVDVDNSVRGGRTPKRRCAPLGVNFPEVSDHGLSVMKVALFPALLLALPLPAEAAAASAVPSALWAYAHYLSIFTIFGCLSAERTIVRAGMSEDEENLIVTLDLIYGLMAVLLIGSGLARATSFGKGSDFYLNESLFWVKMSLSGIWGGLSLFPSVTFYKRKFARKEGEVVPPLSEKLAKRLQSVINAEITAVLSIPLLATLMARGVGYWQDFPWQFGLATAILATVGSFYVFASQAFAWSEDDNMELIE